MFWVNFLKILLLSIPLPSLLLSIEWLELRSALLSKSLLQPMTSNPPSQIATSNPRLQADTHFAVDMFPYKTTELFQKSGFRSKPPWKLGNIPLFGTYLSFFWHQNYTLDIIFIVQTKVNLIIYKRKLENNRFYPSVLFCFFVINLNFFYHFVK